MIKIKKPKLNEYLFCSKSAYKDINEPWHIGYVDKIIIDAIGTYVEIRGCAVWWRHFWRISESEAEDILRMAKNYL